MRGKENGALGIKKINTIFITTMLVLGMFVLAVTPPGEEPAEIENWPDEGEWIDYTFRGERIRDWEDKPYENDPTHGIANVAPAAVDIASGVDATGGGEENNPGDYTSVQYLYKDVDGDTVGCDNIDDDWLFLRMRVADDPQHGGKYYYKAYHWDILIEVDGDLWSEFVVDLNGGDGYFKFGSVGVFYNNTEDYEYDPDTDWVWVQEASSAKNTFTRAVPIDYGTESPSDDQWWIEYRIPVTAFTDHSGNQKLCKDTGFLLFFSTSASLTNPLQKDWMGEYIFGEPANITVVKTVLEDEVAPGDTLHYRIYYNNTGDFNASDVWVTDTIPDYTTFVESDPAYDSVDGRTYNWHFTDVAPGNHTLYLNVTVDADVPDGTILRNVAVLNYTDHHGNEQPGSEDETENPVSGPDMTITKDADREYANPGDVIHYTLEYENLGSGGAYDLVIQDTLADYTTFWYSAPDYTSVTDNTYTWEIDYIPGYFSGTIHVFVTVDPYTPDGTSLNNQVTLDYQDVNGNQYPQEEDSETVTATTPSMTFSKEANVEFADPGDTVIYTLSYENTGSGDAHNVVVVDTLPFDVTFVDSDPDPDDITNNVLTWNLGTVAGYASGTITITVTVNVGTDDGIVLNNVATLDYEDANGNPFDQLSAEDDVTVTSPVMTFSKEANVDYADPGDTIIYTLSYENLGSGDATDVTITDTLPADVTLVDTDPDYDDVSGTTYTWYIGTVAGGASGTITITVTVNVGVGDGVVLYNFATFDYDDANGNPYDQITDETETTVTAPVMTFSKEASVDYADPGDTIIYTLSYENLGDGDATDVTITDTLPADVTVVDMDPDYDDVSGTTYTWYIGTVAGGASGTITITVTVNSGVDDGVVLYNFATFDYDDDNGNPYDQITDDTETTVTAPVMTFSKEADVDYADPGDTIIYTLSYENLGDGDATDVTITDTLPDDVTFVDSDPDYDDLSGTTYTWYIGTVAGGAGGTITITVTVNSGVDDGVVLYNFATFDYDDDNGNPYDQMTDDAETTVTAPVMCFIKEADVDYADPGDTIIYTLSYQNLGDGDATDVTITDTIPDDVTFVSSNPDYDDVSGTTYTWYIGTVAGGASGTVTITVTVNVGVGDGELLHNTATFDYDDDNGNPYDQESDFADVTVTAPVMTFSKDVNVDYADPGDTVIYTLDYENTGMGDATDVTVTDTISDDVTFVSSNPNYDDLTGNTYTWYIGTVAGGASGSITITVTVNAGVADETIIHNEATFDYDDANGNPYVQMSDDADFTVTAPDMTFSKSASVTQADPGDTIVYTLEYENTGSGEATDVTVTDTIPGDVTFDSSNPGYDDLTGSTYTWYIGTVAGGASGIITITVVVNVGVADGTVLHNTGTLDYDDANGNPYDQETDSADVTVTAPDMTFSKSANVDSADPGDTIIYTLHYENEGSGEATDVVVTDTVPGDVTVVSTDPVHDDLTGSTYTWNIGSVAGYGSGTITITVTVNVGVADGTVLHNAGTLDYDDANGNPYDQETGSADVTVTAPDMTFSKSADVTAADPGDTIVYTLTYNNVGSGEATNVVVTDTIPIDVILETSDPGYDSVSGSTYTWNIGTVAGYGSGTITITVVVKIGTDDGTLLHNEGTLDYDDANGNPYDQETDYADVYVTAPVGSITKTADVTHADPGDLITYTITFENSGSGNATNVWINDTIPASTTLESTSETPDSQNGDTYTWFYPLIGDGTTITITIVVSVDVGTPDLELLHNTVTMDYSDDNENPLPQESDSADVEVTAPVLTFVKTASVSKADPGDTIVYSLDYTNSGSGWASLVEIVDTIPAHTTFVSSTPAPSSSSGDEYTYTIGGVAPGASESVTITVTVDVGTADGTLLHNTATFDYADANGNYYTQLSDYADVSVTAPVMTITKTASVSTADPGDTIIYTIEYDNTGSGWASLIKIVDTIPEDTTFIGATPSPTSESGNVLTWDLGDVAPGTSEIIEIEVVVNVGTADETLLHNTVTLDYADANGNYYVQKDDYADVVVTAPVMSMSKNSDLAEADPGDTIVYTIEYENSGTGDASNVVIIDTLPAHVTYVSASPSPDSIVGNVLTWNVGDVAAETLWEITITVTVNPGTADETILLNKVTLDYSDNNGNFIEQLDDTAQTTVTAPIMTLSKEAGQVTILEYVLANFTIRIAGEKWHDVRLTLFYNGVGTDVASVTRFPGDPDDQSVTIYDVKVGVIPGTFSAAITYTPFDDDINGQWWGADPCWLTITFPDGVSKRLHHTFNVRHNDTWIWTIDDFTPYIGGQPIIREAIVPYLITYENIGTGDASNVVITDTLPAGAELLDSDPLFDNQIGNDYIWNIGVVLSEEIGNIYIIIGYIFEDNGTILTNEVTLDYSDANGNYIEQLYDSVDVVLVSYTSEKIAHMVSGGFVPKEGTGDLGGGVKTLKTASLSLGTDLICSTAIPEVPMDLPEEDGTDNVPHFAELPEIIVDEPQPVEHETVTISKPIVMGEPITVKAETIIEKDVHSPTITITQTHVENEPETVTQIQPSQMAPLEDQVLLQKELSTKEPVCNELQTLESVLVPSGASVSVSAILTLATLMFTMSALAVGIYTHRKEKIVKRR